MPPVWTEVNATGWDVIIGNEPTVVKARVAGVLVTLPRLFDMTTEKTAPWSAALTAGVV
jgi:hypothetical protein